MSFGQINATPPRIVAMQAVIEAIDRAIADEEGLQPIDLGGMVAG